MARAGHGFVVVVVVVVVVVGGGDGGGGEEKPAAHRDYARAEAASDLRPAAGRHRGHTERGGDPGDPRRDIRPGVGAAAARAAALLSLPALPAHPHPYLLPVDIRGDPNRDIRPGVGAFSALSLPTLDSSSCPPLSPPTHFPACVRRASLMPPCPDLSLFGGKAAALVSRRIDYFIQSPVSYTGRAAAGHSPQARRAARGTPPGAAGRRLQVRSPSLHSSPVAARSQKLVVAQGGLEPGRLGSIGGHLLDQAGGALVCPIGPPRSFQHERGWRG